MGLPPGLRSHELQQLYSHARPAGTANSDYESLNVHIISLYEQIVF